MIQNDSLRRSHSGDNEGVGRCDGQARGRLQASPIVRLIPKQYTEPGREEVDQVFNEVSYRLEQVAPGLWRNSPLGFEAS